MSTTSDRLGQQATELTKDLQEIGSIVKDAAQERIGQLRADVSQQYEHGKDQVLSVERMFEQYLRQRPIKSILIAAGVGLLVGRFCLRR